MMIRTRSLSSLTPMSVRVLGPFPAQSAPLFWENGSWELITARNWGAIDAVFHIPELLTSGAVSDDADLNRRVLEAGNPLTS
jgi:hypothetical protein